MEDFTGGFGERMKGLNLVFMGMTTKERMHLALTGVSDCFLSFSAELVRL